MNNLEEKIIKRFNTVSENSEIVAETLADSNFAWKAISQYLPSGREAKILDVGCGKGRFSRKLKDLGFEVIGLEPSTGLVKIAKKNNPDILFVEASATKMPFPDDTFDILICVSVLEHIPDTQKALQEMARVLKNGGHLLVLDRNIFGLHPLYLVPTILWIKFFGEKNKWLLYPKHFEFQEIYFIPWRLNRLIKQYFKNSKIHYIHYAPEDKKYPLMKGILISIRTIIAKLLHLLCPILDYYVIWEAEK